jgi:excisionase family DNA binding protein
MPVEDKLSNQRLALKPSEAASLLGCHENSIRKWCHEGRLAHKRIGKRLFIVRKDLEAFFNGEGHEGP